jgi:hypothetical protein
MADNKSVLEEALLEAQQLEEAVKSNAKEILAATMKQEIEELVKESLNEQEEDDFVDEDEVSLDFEDDDDEEYEDQEEEEFVAPEGEEEAMVSIGMEMGTDEPALDLTRASDDEVLKVFKSMGAEDGIVVTQDGDTIDIEDQEAGTEYKIELAESKFRNNLLIREGYDKKDSMDETFVDAVDDSEMYEMDYMDKETMEGYGKHHMDEMEDEYMEGYGKKHMSEMEDEPIYEISLEDEMALGEEDMDFEELNELENEMEMEEGSHWGGNKHDYHREMGADGHRHRMGDVGGGKYGKGGHYKDYEMLEGDYSDRHMNEQTFMDKVMKQINDLLDDAEKAKLKEKGGSSWIKGVLEKAKKEANKKAMVKKALGFFKSDGIITSDKSGSLGSFLARIMQKELEDNPSQKGLRKSGTGESIPARTRTEMLKGVGGVKKGEEEVDEASRTYGFGSKSGRGLRKAFTPNRYHEYPMNESSRDSINKIIETAKQLQTENRHYREKNKEYRQALKVFRDKLNEVAVFNANLAYSTKLFTEHSTTKKEKVNILRRFDNVTTLNESKNLFNSLNSELNSKVNKLNESVQKTITKTPSGGSSVNLIESKTYESPQITRMREIMGKL